MGLQPDLKLTRQQFFLKIYAEEEFIKQNLTPAGKVPCVYVICFCQISQGSQHRRTMHCDSFCSHC